MFGTVFNVYYGGTKCLVMVAVVCFYSMLKFIIIIVRYKLRQFI